MIVNVPKGIKYSIIESEQGYQPQKEYGDKELYPMFDTLRDAIIFMQYMEPEFKIGIVGNTQIIKIII